MSYDAQTLRQKAVLNVTPDGSEGGIWASDTGPAADGDGNVFVPTANGTFDAATGGRDYGDSVLKLDPSTLAIKDFFTPRDEKKLSDDDADLGSSGPTLLAQQTGSKRRLLVQPTKAGTLYVLDANELGKFHPQRNASVQQFQFPDGFYGAAATWNGHVYAVASNDFLRDFTVSGDTLQPASRAASPKFDNPGAIPSVSANGAASGIIWLVSTRSWNGTDRRAVLFAYDARNPTAPIYTSEQNPQRDHASLATRFVIPVVQKGRVYFGTRDEVDVYGLLK
jgi:hypothetical protein